MASSGLIAIKRRIKSINNTKKITKAIGLVATSKLKKAREILEVNNAYYNKMREIVRQTIKDTQDPNNNYIKGNNSNKKLYIAITSDAGLCGGYNSKVVSKTFEALNRDKENSMLIIVGQKGRAYFKKYKFESIAEFVEMEEIPTVKEASVILDKALDLYFNEKIGEINVVYTEFFSAVKQEVKVKRIVPFDLEDINKDFTDNGVAEFEPKADSIVNEIYSLFLKAALVNYMITSRTSENASKMTAMDGATKNADDLLEKLNLKYNRIRQSIITQEISEIVGGAEAQK